MNSRSVPRLLAAGALTILGSVFAAAPASAAEGHRHDSHAVLKLNEGAKWQTDDALRTGMERIRTAVAHAIPEVHAGRYDAAQYRTLGETVERQVAYIVQNCKLQPDADAALHAIIAEIGKGLDVITTRSGGGRRADGVIHLARALDDYAAHFEHPGWKRLETGH